MDEVVRLLLRVQKRRGHSPRLHGTAFAFHQLYKSLLIYDERPIDAGMVKIRGVPVVMVEVAEREPVLCTDGPSVPSLEPAFAWSMTYVDEDGVAGVVWHMPYLPSRQQLRAARQLLDMSQVDAGALVERGGHSISKHERGVRDMPDTLVQSLADAYEERGVDFQPNGYTGAVAL